MAESSATGNAPREVSWGNRLLAPLALIAVVIAIVVIVTSSTGEESADSGTSEGQSRVENSGGDGEGAENPRFYAVEEGDTLSGIAEKFDVSVKRLERLNPEIDPQTVGAGQEVKIR